MVAERTAKINKRKLLRELLVLGGVALVIFLIGFLPWLAKQPIPGYDPHAKYQKMVKVVQEYDYSKGRSSDLESRLDAVTSGVGNDPVGYYYNLKAKYYYYHEVGEYANSNVVAEEAKKYVSTDAERLFLYETLVENYRMLGDDEKAEEYQQKHDKIRAYE